MTLDEIIDTSRVLLDDRKDPHKWKDSELVYFINNAERKLCERCYLLEEAGAATYQKPVVFSATGNTITRSDVGGSFFIDGFFIGNEIKTDNASNPGPFIISDVTDTVITTAETLVNSTDATCSIISSISAFFVSNNLPLYTTDTRIIRINEARAVVTGKLFSIIRDNVLNVLNLNYPEWRTMDSDKPELLLVKGFGKNRVRLHRIPDADDVCLMTVFRYPISSLSEDYMDNSPEISEEFHRFLFNWVLYEAWSVNDSEKEDLKRASKHFALFNDVDIPEIRRLQTIKDYSEMANCPFPGTI